MQLRIVPYTLEDNEEALALEKTCPQGDALMLRFRRPTFHARSTVYEHSVILCAKEGERLVGIAAGALKQVMLHGRMVRALYGYDLRVHPDWRRYGTARKLAQAVIDELSPAECIYSYVAGQNARALQFTRRAFGARSVIELQYLVIPVFRQKPGGARCEEVPASVVREGLVNGTGGYELVPGFAGELMHGHVSSLVVKPGTSGCSVWTNEALLAEEVVRLPMSIRFLRCLSIPLFPLHLFPQIPGRGAVLKSLFIHDLFARSRSDLRELLSAVNNLAFSAGRTMLFILLQSGNPLITMVREAGFQFFSVPYVFLAKGEEFPAQDEKLYIDIRDL